MHFAAVAKAHFDFGRVYVHIDSGRVDLDIQRIHRLAVAVQHILVGAAGGVGENFVAHVATIDVGKLLVGAGASGVGQTGAAPDAHGGLAVGAAGAAFVMHGDGLGDKLGAQHVGQALVVGAKAVDSAGVIEAASAVHAVRTARAVHIARAIHAACVICAIRAARAARPVHAARADAGAPLLGQLALVPDGKTHVGPHQRVAAHGVKAVCQLRRVGF